MKMEVSGMEVCGKMQKNQSFCNKYAYFIESLLQNAPILKNMYICKT